MPETIAAILYGALVGISLGLTGGGGSIFAVPLLIYGLGLQLRAAVAVSLLVVGLTAAYGALLQYRAGLVHWRAGAILGVGGVLAAPFGSMLGRLLPDSLTLLLFAALMIVIGIAMWRRPDKATEVPITSRISCPVPAGEAKAFQPTCAMKIAVAGVATGLLSGLFGVGGGFLIVPALLTVARLPVPRTLATSLVGIGIISIAAFTANATHLTPELHKPGLLFLLGAGLGMTGGTALKRFIPAKILKNTFALMVIATALAIIVMSL